MTTEGPLPATDSDTGARRRPPAWLVALGCVTAGLLILPMVLGEWERYAMVALNGLAAFGLWRGDAAGRALAAFVAVAAAPALGA